MELWYMTKLTYQIGGKRSGNAINKEGKKGYSHGKKENCILNSLYTEK